MLDVGCWMLDVGCWMLDVGCWMLDVGCWMLDVGCSMLDVRCWMFDGGWVIPFSNSPHCLFDLTSTLSHPVDSSPPALASSSHECKSALFPRAHAREVPEPCGCHNSRPANASQSYVASRAASPAYSDPPL